MTGGATTAGRMAAPRGDRADRPHAGDGGATTGTSGLRTALLWLAFAGGLSFVAGLFVAPDRVWAGLLMGFTWLTTLSLAGPVFIALLVLAGARWWTPLQRVPEAMAAALPAAAATGVVLLFGQHALYEWSHDSVVAADPLLAHKSAWLSELPFALRTVAVFAAWLALSSVLTSRLHRFGLTGAREDRRRLLRSAALFVAVLAPTWSVATFDWLMSLEPHWFSTMFALMHLGGLASAGLAAAILLVLAAETSGHLAGRLRADHLHDLGKLLFAVTLFWAYCWYCQYMLVWYTDIPEETTHYVARQQGSWWLLVQAALVLKWGVPFVALLARTTCRSRTVLRRVALAVLAGHALDLYVQVGPPLMGEVPALGVWEAGPVVGAVAFFFLVALRALERIEPVPATHPHLPDSLTYHTP